MARKVRLEYAGARYHVINRGNYRSDIFAHDGAKMAFEKTLFEACKKAHWRLHAFVIMSNHYHLAVETPEGNLVEGMQWLQATFANRFNRFRHEVGHVFQGRYTAILLEDFDVLGAVRHYIHLNPVRAKIMSAEKLPKWRFGSYHYLNKVRPPFLILDTCLKAAGGLVDNRAGRRNYAEFLDWLAEDETMQKELKFDKMCRGWAVGSKSFKRELVRDHEEQLQKLDLDERDLCEVRELQWIAQIEKCQTRLREAGVTFECEGKFAPWKVAVAAFLKTFCTAKNPWISKQLEMGHPDTVSRCVGEIYTGRREEARKLLQFLSASRV